MKIKTILIIVGIIIVISGFAAAGIYRNKYRAEKAERERWQKNYKIVQDSVETIKGKNGLLALRLEAESLTIAEIRTYYQNLTADVADMKIQMRKVTGITAFNTETTNQINTFFKDSTRIDTLPLETLDYSDRWLDLHIRKEGLKARVISQTRDSLIQVLHWDFKGKFWPTRFLTKKEYWQDIKSMNPNSRIVYSKWIVPVRN